MSKILWVVSALLLAAIAGCTSFNPAPAPPPNTSQVSGTTAQMPPDQAYRYLADRAQKGEVVGDLVTPEAQTRVTVMAESIVVGLEGRGTDRYDSKLKPSLTKLLVKNFDSLDIASQIINSKDGAPVRVTAEIPPLVRKGDKIDIMVESLDPSVNIEGGTLIDTPLERFVQLGIPTHAGFRTRSGLVSQGIEGFARGDVTLNAGYKNGVRLKGEVPTVGYIPAGGMSEKTWGYRLMLKKPDAYTSQLIEAAFQNRFSNWLNVKNSQGSASTSEFVIISMPNRYQGYWKRYLDVVLRIPVRPPVKEERLRDIDRLAASLNSADPQARYESECALEAYGREAAPALFELLRTSNVGARQSALRVLAFVDDARTVDPLVDESRRSQGRFRAESAYLLSILGGERGERRLSESDRINQRLVEMLDDPDPQARFTALMALERTGVKEAPVRIYYSPEARSFAMYLVETRGEQAVVVSAEDSVRRIAIFGANVRVKSPFRGGVGPVTLNVTPDGIEIQHKRREGSAPILLRTHEVANLVSALDRMYVSINDILGVLSQLNERGAIDAKMYWAE